MPLSTQKQQHQQIINISFSRNVAAVAAVTKPNINDRSTSTKDQHFIYSIIEPGTGC